MSASESVVRAVASTGLDREVDEMAELRAELERVKAQRDKLRDDYEPTISSDFLSRTADGAMVLTFGGAKVILSRIAEALAKILDDPSGYAENYVSMHAASPEGKTYEVVVRRGGKPTEHDFRRKAEAELADLRVRLEAVLAQHWDWKAGRTLHAAITAVLADSDLS
jgi:hypothetical protein